MKKMPDIGSVFVIGIVFTVIFLIIQMGAEKLHYPFSIFLFGFITAWVALYWPRIKEDESKNIEKNNKEDKTFVIGTNRKRTKLDDELDQFVLDKYYKENKEKRTSEKDKEILEKSYLIEK